MRERKARQFTNVLFSSRRIQQISCRRGSKLGWLSRRGLMPIIARSLDRAQYVRSVSLMRRRDIAYQSRRKCSLKCFTVDIRTPVPNSYMTQGSSNMLLRLPSLPPGLSWRARCSIFRPPSSLGFDGTHSLIQRFESWVWMMMKAVTENCCEPAS